jgi:ketosteroid isomerase-like protein
MKTTAFSNAERAIRDYYRHADAGSTESALALFAEDVEIRFGNRPPGKGVATLVSAAANLATVCASVRHEVTNTFVDASGLKGASELAMTYVRHDGSEFAVPAAGIFGFNDDGAITKYHVFVDLTGLVAP